jgi:hypothetical protein
MLNRRRLATTALMGSTGCILAFISACSSQKPGIERDSGALDAASDQDAGALDATPDRAMTGVVWTAESSAIDVSCLTTLLGSKRIRATRDQLFDDQLSMLSALTLIPPDGQCSADYTSCSVAVTASDGTVATYVADGGGSSCRSQSGLLISFQSFDPFLRSVPCVSGNQVVGTADGGPTFASIFPNVLCFNGVRVAPSSTVSRVLVVADPSVPRHLELDSCNNSSLLPAPVHPQLFAPDGVTLLSVGTAVSDPGPDGTCWRLDYTFPAAGMYPLSIGIDGIPPGDIYLRFY